MDEARTVRALGARGIGLSAAGPADPYPGDLLTNELDGDGTAASAAWRCWHGFHQELARLSGDSRHVVAERSGHNMHLDDPSLVVSTIRDVLRSVRTGSRLEADRPGQ